jgi:fumarate reductase subunit D
VADAPAGWVAAAAGGMLLAVLVAVLILVGSGTRRA